MRRGLQGQKATSLLCYVVTGLQDSARIQALALRDDVPM
jgi:hypothetical protein